MTKNTTATKATKVVVTEVTEETISATEFAATLVEQVVEAAPTPAPAPVYPDAVIDNNGVCVITPEDALYPVGLKHLRKQPTLYAIGNLALLQSEKFFAVVTSNNTSSRVMNSCGASMVAAAKAGATILLGNTVDFGQSQYNYTTKQSTHLHDGFVVQNQVATIPTVAFLAKPLDPEMYAGLDMTHLCIVTAVPPKKVKGDLAAANLRAICIGKMAYAAIAGEVSTNGGAVAQMFRLVYGPARGLVFIYPVAKDAAGKDTANLFFLDEDECILIQSLSQITAALSM